MSVAAAAASSTFFSSVAIAQTADGGAVEADAGAEAEAPVDAEAPVEADAGANAATPPKEPATAAAAVYDNHDVPVTTGVPIPPPPPGGESPKRAVPDYSGRGEEPTTAGDVALWIPRVILSPLYFVSEYIIRRPLGWLITTA